MEKDVLLQDVFLPPLRSQIVVIPKKKSSLSLLPDDVLGHHIIASFLRPWDAHLFLVSRRFDRVLRLWSPFVRLRPPKLPCTVHLEVDVWASVPNNFESLTTTTPSSASSSSQSVRSNEAVSPAASYRVLTPSSNSIGYSPPVPLNFSLAPNGTTSPSTREVFAANRFSKSFPSSPLQGTTNTTAPVRKMLSRNIWTLTQQLWDLPLLLQKFDWIPGYHCRNRREWSVEGEKDHDPRETIWILVGKLIYRMKKNSDKGGGKMGVDKPNYIEVRDAEGIVVKGYISVAESDEIVMAAKVFGKVESLKRESGSSRF